MSNKRPQPTDVLIARLRRVAKKIDQLLDHDWAGTSDATTWRARSNTCWQAAARLELLNNPEATRCEGCSEKATTEDSVGVPLCDACYAALD